MALARMLVPRWPPPERLQPLVGRHRHRRANGAPGRISRTLQKPKHRFGRRESVCPLQAARLAQAARRMHSRAVRSSSRRGARVAARASRRRARGFQQPPPDSRFPCCGDTVQAPARVRPSWERLAREMRYVRMSEGSGQFDLHSRHKRRSGKKKLFLFNLHYYVAHLLAPWHARRRRRPRPCFRLQGAPRPFRGCGVWGWRGREV